MKNHLNRYIFYVLLCLIPLGAGARVKLAEWNFNTVYTQSTGNDTTFFTPSSTALTADPNITLSTGKFKIYPDSSVSSTGKYFYNAVTTYCQLKTGYSNYVSRIMFQGPNSISDYSTSSNHKNYFQFSFPTTGYDSITINFSIAGGQNSTSDYVELVYSGDGGSSWVDAGSYNMLSGWWLYKSNSVTISAKNKSNVLLRLIANTTSTSGTANFNLDYLNITGVSTAVNKSSTITWPLNTGVAGQTGTYTTVSDSNYIRTNWVDKGSNLSYASTSTTYSKTYTLFQPASQSATATSGDIVSFNLRPKTGLRFKPTAVSFDCMRFGTDGGLIDVAWKSADGSVTSIASALKPARNNSGAGTSVSYDLSSLALPDTSGDCSLLVYIYSLGTTKTIGLANIVITGKITGTPADVTTHKLTASVYPGGAGTITTSPVGNEFDAGTSITLTAATRNFGYQFKEWQDGNGNVLSTDKAITFSLIQDTTIKAVYETLTTYSFTVNILGSEWGTVALTPSPTNGKYEAGTTVSMAITSNPVTTFSYWDDNTTATSRTVTVNGDKTYSATFDEVPFIVGWSFKSTTPTSARAGDYYSETSNTGLLNVYTQSNTVTSWLAGSGAFSPSTPCAYLWTPSTSFASDRRYWMASFSTVGYSNIIVKSQMAGSYQHYLTQKMQCSLDASSWIDMDSIDISTSTWTDLNDTLPAAFEGQSKVYVRWIASTSSTLVGTGNDGTALTNVYVFADVTAVKDTVAPKLVSVVPVEGSTNASANGSIVLTFDEKMKAGSGSCTLGSTTLTPVFGSKTVTLAYTKLSYNTNYTFTVPAGALTDAYGNSYSGITVNFTTMTRPIPTAKLYDAVVAKDGSGDYSTVQAAVSAAPSSRVLPYLIFVKNGTYSGHIDIPSTKPYIHLIGQQRDSVIISDARLSGSSSAFPDSTVYSVSQGASVVVNSANCYFENITFENKFGYDNVSGPQALALYTVNDRITLNNCWLRSYQDTYLSTYGNVAYRHYLKNCRIEGAVDFIYGGGDVFFDSDTIYCKRSSGGYIVAPSHLSGTEWGYVFSNCTIDGPISSYTTYLGRPWANSPKASFFNTISKIGIYPVGWYEHMGAIPSVFADYNTMDKDGNALDLSYRISKYWYLSGTDTIKGTAKNSYTDAEAAEFTYVNVTSGSDNWDPRTITETTDAPVITLTGDSVSWTAVDYAICYVIKVNNKVVGFTTSSGYKLKTHGTVKVVAASEYGALSKESNCVDYSYSTEVKNTESALNLKVCQFTDHVEVCNIPQSSQVRVYSFTGSLIIYNHNVSDQITIPVKQNLIIQVLSTEGIKVVKIIKR